VRVEVPPEGAEERDLELVERLVARLVHARRLRRRADEEPREQVRQRRVVLEEGEEAREQIGPLQERALERRAPAERDVVPAAGARHAPVDEVLLRVETAVERR